jgi:hypothetical protein
VSGRQPTTSCWPCEIDGSSQRIYARLSRLSTSREKLHSVVIETLRSDHQRSFLEMIEILSEDRHWHSYLRKAMDIWLPLHQEGPYHALRTSYNVGELTSGSDGYNADKPLEKVVEEEWAAVPGRQAMDLTADRLGPLAEVTEQFKRLSFFSENEVLPSLGRQFWQRSNGSFRLWRGGAMVVRTRFRLGHLPQSHRCVCGGSQTHVNLKSHESPFFNHRRRVKSKELVFVGLGEGNVWVRVLEGGPRQFPGKVQYMSVGSAQTVIPSVRACQTRNYSKVCRDPYFCFRWKLSGSRSSAVRNSR